MFSDNVTFFTEEQKKRGLKRTLDEPGGVSTSVL